MTESLGKKSISAVIWKFAERFVAQGVTTIVGIVLARILEPEHYGTIAIANIFITICNVFVVSGFGEALIQKKNVDDVDFSTLFFLNIGLSIFLYAILFISAPHIAAFYGPGYESVTNILRVLGLRLILAAVNSIQHAKVARELAFKKYFYVTIVGTIVSGIVGITMAYTGFGVWALVAQYMTNTTIDTIMLFVFVRWLPKLKFSIKQTKSEIKYGSKMLSTALLSTVVSESEQLLIGKTYTSSDLAFYTKGTTYPKLVANNLSIAISSSIFPVLSKIQDDVELSQKYVAKAVRFISFLVFPALIGLALVAEDFVMVLLTDKWLPSVPFIRLMCLYYLIYPLIITNSQSLTASGNAKLHARITYIIHVVRLAILIITIKFGVFWIAFGRIVICVIEYFVKTIPTQKRLNYGLIKQLKDMLPHIFGCLIMAILVLGVRKLAMLSGANALISLIVQIFVGVFVYALYELLNRNAQMNYIISLLKEKIEKRKNNGFFNRNTN